MRLVQCLRILARALDYAKDPDPDHWKTINGSHVHLDKNGNYDGGAESKFNGRHHYGPGWRQKSALMNRLAVALHAGVNQKNVAPPATNGGQGAANGGNLNTEEPTDIKGWAKKLSGLGVSANFGNMDENVGCKNLKEVHSILTSIPKVTEFAKREGISLISKPLGRAHGNTRFYCMAGAININIDSTSHKDEAQIKQRVRRYAEENFKMPCSPEHAVHYTESHEMGHAIQAIAVYSRIPNTTYFTCKHDFKAETVKIKREIIKCAKELDPKVNTRTFKRYMSEYGQTDPREFFAECFANYRCGEPNIMGRAIGLWLERWQKE